MCWTAFLNCNLNPELLSKRPFTGDQVKVHLVLVCEFTTLCRFLSLVVWWFWLNGGYKTITMDEQLSICN